MVSHLGEYQGGVIAPGVMISCEALFLKASKLPRVEIFAKPKSVIAKDTLSSMNAGIIYGYAGLGDLIATGTSPESRNRAFGEKLGAGIPAARALELFNRDSLTEIHLRHRPEADAEIIAMAVEGLEAAGLPRGAAVLKINNRKLLNGLLTQAGAASEGQKLAVLRAVESCQLDWNDPLRIGVSSVCPATFTRMPMSLSTAPSLSMSPSASGVSVAPLSAAATSRSKMVRAALPSSL